jgi:hypothetical protein
MHTGRITEEDEERLFEPLSAPLPLSLQVGLEKREAVVYDDEGDSDVEEEEFENTAFRVQKKQRGRHLKPAQLKRVEDFLSEPVDKVGLFAEDFDPNSSQKNSALVAPPAGIDEWLKSKPLLQRNSETEQEWSAERTTALVGSHVVAIPPPHSNVLVLEWSRVVSAFHSVFDAAYDTKKSKGSKKAHFDCVERGASNLNTFDGIKGQSWSTLLFLDALMYGVLQKKSVRHPAWARRTFNQHDILDQAIAAVCSEAIITHRLGSDLAPISFVQIRLRGFEWTSYETMGLLLPTIKNNSKSTPRYNSVAQQLTDSTVTKSDLPLVILRRVLREAKGIIDTPAERYSVISNNFAGQETYGASASSSSSSSSSSSTAAAAASAVPPAAPSAASAAAASSSGATFGD